MKFFSYDSRFSQIVLKICSGCCLNLIWFLCSLPIFTIGASTAALYSVTLKLARDETPRLLPEFMKAFRSNFKQATVLWLILLGFGILLGTDGYILYHLYRSTTGAIAVICTLGLALIIVSAIAYVVVLIYVFPLTASVVNTNFNMLKNSLLVGIRYLFCTILVFAIHFAMFFLVVAIFTPLIVFGEGVCALLSSYLLVNVIRAVSYVEEEE